MKLYYGTREIASQADCDVLAQELEVDPVVTQVIVDSLREGEAVNPQDFEEKDRSGVVRLLSSIQGGSPEDPKGKSRAKGGSVQDAKAEADADFDQSAIAAIVKEQTEQLSDHFEHVDGEWAIRSDNPPSVEDCYDAMATTLRVHNSSAAVIDYAQWSAANLLDLAERLYGETFNVAQLTRITGRNRTTCNNWKKTWEWVRRNKRYNVLYAVHQEIARTPKASDKAKNILLQKCEDHQFTAAQARKLLRHHLALTKTLGDEDESAERIAEMRSEQLETIFGKPKQKLQRFFVMEGQVVWEAFAKPGEVPKGDWVIRLPLTSKVTVWRKGKRKPHQDWEKYIKREVFIEDREGIVDPPKRRMAPYPEPAAKPKE